MAYVNLPDSKLGIGIASLVGSLIGLITERISRQVVELQNKLQSSCGNINVLVSLSRKLSGLIGSLTAIKSRIEKLKRIVNPLDKVIRVLNIAIRLLKFLPIPNTTTTTGVTNTFSDILHKLKEFVRQLKDDITIVRIACDQALTLIDRIISELKRLDSIIKNCLDRATSENKKEAQDEILRQNGLDPDQVLRAVDDRDFRRLGSILFKDSTSLQKFNNLSPSDKTIYSGNYGLDPKDVAKSAFTKNIDQGDTALQASYKTGLTPQETTDTLKQINVLAPKEQESSSLKDLQKNTQNSLLYPQPEVGITLVSGDRAVGLALIAEDTPKNQQLFYHTGPDGTSYTITVIETDLSLVAPRRRAIAKDRQGIIRYRSDESFSSSTQVLVDEVKFNIDNNIF